MSIATHIKDNPFIVSLGAGKNQIPLIKAARKLGYRVIGVDRDIHAPGFNLCDLKIQESIVNVEGIHEKLGELMPDSPIVSIATRSWGDAVLSNSILCEEYQLPYMPSESARMFLDKNRMHRIYEKLGFNQTRQWLLAELPLPRTESEFPVIIKPRRGHGKEQTRLLFNNDELEEARSEIEINETNGTDDFIVENFVEGKEIIVFGLVAEGKFNFIAATDKVKSEEPWFVDLAHVFPSLSLERTKDFIEAGQGLADTMKLHTTPLIMEIILTPQGKVHIVEAVPEFGGEFIADRLLPAAMGYDYFAEYIQFQANGTFKPTVPTRYPRGLWFLYYIHAPNDGILKSWSPEAAESVRGIESGEFFTAPGSQIYRPEHNHQRLGMLMGRAGTLAKAMTIISNAMSALEMEIE